MFAFLDIISGVVIAIAACAIPIVALLAIESRRYRRASALQRLVIDIDARKAGRESGDPALHIRPVVVTALRAIVAPGAWLIARWIS